MQDSNTVKLSKTNEYLKTKSFHMMLMESDDFHNILKSPKVNALEDEIPSLLLKKILSEDDYYEAFEKAVQSQFDSFYLCAVSDGVITENASYHKMNILMAIEKLLTEQKDFFAENEKKKFFQIREMVSFQNFSSFNSSSIYRIEIENTPYSIPVANIIEFISKPKDELEALCSKKNAKLLYGLIPEHFVFAVVDYFKKTKAFDNYLVPPKIKDNYELLKSSSLIDIEAIDKFNRQEMDLSKVFVNEDLQNRAKDGIVPSDDALKKSIRIYLNLCKILTYSMADFVNEFVPLSNSAARIEKITLDNNEVSAYEFNLILAKILSEEGINFQIMFENIDGQIHPSTSFRCGPYLLSADANSIYLNGDISRVKRGETLVGLTCLNRNEKTQEKFHSKLLGIYTDMLRQDNLIPHVDSFESVFKSYTKNTENLRDLTTKEKMEIFISKLAIATEKGVDLFSYVHTLMSSLFDEYERLNQVDYRILKVHDEGNDAKAIVVIAYNEEDFTSQTKRTVYYSLMSDGSIIPVSKRELKTKIRQHIYEYVNKEEPEIPGIRTERKIDDDTRKTTTIK